MYKLMAIDMDGTLLTEEKKISPKTKEALDMAKEKGVKIVLATGRPIDGVMRYLEELNLIQNDQYVLSFNGAIIRNTGTKEVICRDTLKGKDYVHLYNVSKELGVNIHAFSLDGCHTPKMNKYTEVEGKINGINVFEKNISETDPEEEIVKIMMIDEPEILEEAITKLSKELYDQYTIVRSAPFFLEFLSKTCNKGEGVKLLADTLGIKQEETIAIGDAGNDAHMIEYAGLGVAMGNAVKEIKEMANFITKSNEEDGIAYVVEKFIL